MTKLKPCPYCGKSISPSSDYLRGFENHKMAVVTLFRIKVMQEKNKTLSAVYESWADMIWGIK